MPPRKKLLKTFEYALIWKHTGKRPSRRLAQQPASLLRMMRRIGTADPWMGATVVNLRKGWVHLSMLLQVPFATVADMPIRDVMKAVSAHYGPLDFIRVEWRQVGPWVNLMDPLSTLQTEATVKQDAKIAAVLAEVDAMSPEQLEAWRMQPREGAAK